MNLRGRSRRSELMLNDTEQQRILETRGPRTLTFEPWRARWGTSVRLVSADTTHFSICSRPRVLRCVAGLHGTLLPMTRRRRYGRWRNWRTRLRECGHSTPGWCWWSGGPDAWMRMADPACPCSSVAVPVRVTGTRSPSYGPARSGAPGATAQRKCGPSGARPRRLGWSPAVEQGEVHDDE